MEAMRQSLGHMLGARVNPSFSSHQHGEEVPTRLYHKYQMSASYLTSCTRHVCQLRDSSKVLRLNR
jgi:hypothetical protein